MLNYWRCVLSFFRMAGLDSSQVKILVNDRRLVDDFLSKIGIAHSNRVEVYRFIDRREKMAPSDWTNYATQLGITLGQLESIEKFLADSDTWKTSPELSRVMDSLEGMGVRNYIQYAPQIIRGLDYYTGIVFEAKDLDGGRSILGGGHYDNLVGDVGGDAIPGVGFAMGDVMAGIVLKKYGCVPELSTQPAKVLVTVFDETSYSSSQRLASQLRLAGINVVCSPEAVKLQKQFKFADRMNLSLVIVLGPEEISEGKVTVKDLIRQQQQTIAQGDLVGTLKDLLAQS